MNYLVFLDAQAGELEKILSGTKSMVVRETDPASAISQPVCPGDILYFLKNKNECTLRVKATVVRVFSITNRIDEDLSQILKELQTRLQLTEDQYTYWVAKQQLTFVEFNSAQKVEIIRIAPIQGSYLSNWMAFEKINMITERRIK